MKIDEIFLEGSIEYRCWKCEKITNHVLEKALIGYGDKMDLIYFSICEGCNIYEEFNDLSELNESLDVKMFILMDLERTLRFKKPFYWKANNRGYTDDLNEAGRYNQLEANYKVKSDIDKRTVSIAWEEVKRILRPLGEF